MFARDGAAQRDGRGQDLLEGALSGSTCQVVVWRCEDQGVQVAVSRVGDGRHPYAVSLADLLDGGQHGRDRRPRHADVLGEDRAQPLQRRVGEPSRDEQGFGLVFVRRSISPQCPSIPECGDHRVGLGLTGGAGVSI